MLSCVESNEEDTLPKPKPNPLRVYLTYCIFFVKRKSSREKNRLKIAFSSLFRILRNKNTILCFSQKMLLMLDLTSAKVEWRVQHSREEQHSF